MAGREMNWLDVIILWGTELRAPFVCIYAYLCLIIIIDAHNNPPPNARVAHPAGHGSRNVRSQFPAASNSKLPVGGRPHKSNDADIKLHSQNP